jgi:hypothetical protein
LESARRSDNPSIQIGVIVLQGEQERPTKGVDLHDIAVDVVRHHDKRVLLGI